MKSWDCFDTLIARRFVHPHSIFEEVGKRLNIPNFKEIRIQAERLSGSTYENIYKNIPGIDTCQTFNISTDNDLLRKIHDKEFLVKMPWCRGARVHIESHIKGTSDFVITLE